MMKVGPLPALLWKHGLVRCRRWILSLLEVIVPILPILGFLYCYHKLGGDADNKRVVLTAHNTEHYMISNILDRDVNALYYAPNTSSFVDDLINKVAHILNINEVQAFSSEQDLLLNKGKTLQSSPLMASVIFKNITGNDVPDNLQYSIRSMGNYKTERVHPLLQVAGSHHQYGRIYYLFVVLKTHIDSVFINIKSGRNISIHDSMCIQEFPYPAYNPDESWWFKYAIFIPTMIVLGCMVSLLITIDRVLADKVTGIKEIMKMIGVRLETLWLSHFVNCWVALVPVSIILFILLIAVPIGYTHIPLVPLSSPLIIFVTLILYINYVILFAFAVTTLFSKGLLGCIVGAMVWIISIILSIRSYSMTSSTVTTVLFTFVPNYPLFGAFFAIGLLETRGEGLHWSNLFHSTAEYPLSVGVLWLVLILQQAGLVLFTWYMDQVNPGPYGVAKPFWFPYKNILKRVSPDTPIDLSNEAESFTKNCHFEPVPTDAEVGIEIKNIWKIYKGRGCERAALKGISMNLYMKGITVLLGHNGAGKTTLMSVITGLTDATAGCVLLKKNNGIGLCPQHNLTFPDLTLHQHLMLFGLLKGLTIEESDKEAQSVAESLQLTDKLNWLCGRLSGGQRRRAQLGLALVGHPQILILDEPTTGLDPVSRRQLWDILLEIKNQHTILISSHSMEEADILADRVAILDHGRLKCLGTPIFLKKIFCTGYTVKILTEGGEIAEEEIMKIVTTSGAEVETLPRDGNILSYRLLSHHTQVLPVLFNKLETNKQRLDITSIGLSLTTLEEVFLRVTEGSAPSQTTDTMTVIDLEEGTEKFLQGINLFFSQFYSLFRRKLFYLLSVKKTLLLQVILSVLMFTVPLLERDDEDLQENPPLNISPQIFPNAPLLLPYNLTKEQTPYLLSLGTIYNMHLKEVKDPYSYILSEGEKNPKTSYTKSLVMAIRNVDDKICGMYSTSIYHTLPTIVGLITNMFATMHLQGEPPHISTVNHPITRESLASLFDDDLDLYAIASWVTYITLGFFFIFGIFLSLPVKECVGGQRHLLQLAGPGPSTYWAITLVTDFLLVGLLTIPIFLITTGFYPSEALSLGKIIDPILILGLLHVLTSLCFIYCLSLVIKTTARAYIAFFVLTLFIGIVLSTASTFASLMADHGSKDDSMGFFDIIFSFLLPSYAFSQGLIRVALLSKDNTICKHLSDKLKLETPCCEKKDGICEGFKNHFSDDVNGINAYIFFLIFSSLFYMTLLLLHNYNLLSRAWEYVINKNYEPSKVMAIDEDVQCEKKKVQEEMDGLSDDKSQVLIHRLFKRHFNSLFRKGPEAVKDLNFSIQKGECFGLLGPNGAGKTTTFNIISGIDVPTRGAYYFKGQAKASLGFCPQFDALDQFLTGEQILNLFCRLRGVPANVLSSKVSHMLNSAGLSEYASVPCANYSGGTRRRLSTVVALGAAVSGGDCVLLDEPSAGVDPLSRQSLHTIIQDSRSKGHCIILSSHSMEECEKLVSRLGILRQGELVCLGVPQHLKYKYSNGFLLTIRLRPQYVASSSQDTVDSPSTENLTQLVKVGSSNEVSQLRNAITDSFSCTLKDEHMTVLQYHIEERGSPYSTLFTRMEELKSRHGNILEDYTISDTTLEQVFLSLTREKVKME